MGQFPSTAWSMIASLQADGSQRVAGLESLARSYWKPIYSYLRQALRQEHAEAEDLTQSFLAWLLAGDVLKQFDPARGSFRPYLKTLLHGFTRNQRRVARAQKRGGGQAPVPLGELGGDAIADRRDEGPEAAFDRAWVAELVERASERVRAHYAQADDSTTFEIYLAYDQPPAGVLPTYASVAEQFGVDVRHVRQRLSQVRERLRAEIRLELRDTVRDSAQLESEWQALFLSS